MQLLYLPIIVRRDGLEYSRLQSASRRVTLRLDPLYIFAFCTYLPLADSSGALAQHGCTSYRHPRTVQILDPLSQFFKGTFAFIWWKPWESNPPHAGCKPVSPSLGTWAPNYKEQKNALGLICQIKHLFSRLASALLFFVLCFQ